MSDPLLAVENLTVAFGGLFAVKDLSFAVAPGTVHALIGPNGAGKSTTFNCISRFYKPTAGRITYSGQDITSLPASNMAALGIARSFQNLELFNELSVFENVMIGAHVHCGGSIGRILRARPPEATRRVEEIIERTGLADFRKTKAKNLDFGRQKDAGVRPSPRHWATVAVARRARGGPEKP